MSGYSGCLHPHTWSPVTVGLFVWLCVQCCQHSRPHPQGHEVQPHQPHPHRHCGGRLSQHVGVHPLQCPHVPA